MNTKVTIIKQSKGTTNLKQYQREWGGHYAYAKYIEAIDEILDKRYPAHMKSNPEETETREKRQKFIDKYESKINLNTRGGINKMNEVIKISLKHSDDIGRTQQHQLKTMDHFSKMEVVDSYLHEHVNPESKLYDSTYGFCYNILFKHKNLLPDHVIGILESCKHYSQLKDISLDVDSAGECITLKFRQGDDPVNEKISIENQEGE